MLWLTLTLEALMAAPAEHEVTGLPGWEGALPQRQYAGLVPLALDKDKVTAFYWYVAGPEASSPVVLWLNGGPGGSSIAGYWHEMGPLQVDERSFATRAFNESGVPTVMSSQKTWSSVAHLVYLDSPAGVGI